MPVIKSDSDVARPWRPVLLFLGLPLALFLAAILASETLSVGSKVVAVLVAAIYAAFWGFVSITDSRRRRD